MSSPSRRLAAAPVDRHPRGSRARVLLSSVFGPYAQDDAYGSRAINPMELYHNQVTRVQGVFSLRMFHRTWGLMLIQANVDAPCTLLDFPTLERFVEELRAHPYDVVGISAIMPNVGKVKKMCELIREHQPNATIVVGGHIANLTNIERRVDADHIVRGDGVRWMRQFLGEDEHAPIRHPEIVSGLATRMMGVHVKERRGDVAATVIPSVGCPMGCNFCSTSAMFGGKGSFIDFYKTGDELFRVMCDLERSMGVRSFFVMDENFLLHRKRALRLLELMIEHDKAWALYVFSSAHVLSSYTMEQLVGLGISWVWMGLEGESANFAKLRGEDTREVVRTLQAHGVRVLGSTIIGLPEHTPENIDAAIEYAVGHGTEFHQFMLFTPIPGTELHRECTEKGLMLEPEECDAADAHGQYRFNWRHPHLAAGTETELLLRGFRRDFEVNGPSIVRIVRTMLRGWLRYKNHPDRRIRRRFEWEARDLPRAYAASLWAARRWFRSDRAMADRISETLAELHREFGLRARVVGELAGRYVHLMASRERRRLARGWTLEPPTFYETNFGRA